MSLAITMNLIAAIVVVGGWTAAVWFFYKHLSDPYARPATRRPDAVQAADAGSRPEPVLTGSRAA
ncbi:MAG TPA: hypothetical protein VFO01_19635 [Trebonia sp.]|nr:hypothetical protein [Trebonia sp.]